MIPPSWHMGLYGGHREKFGADVGITKFRPSQEESVDPTWAYSWGTIRTF